MLNIRISEKKIKIFLYTIYYVLYIVYMIFYMNQKADLTLNIFAQVSNVAHVRLV